MTPYRQVPYVYLRKEFDPDGPLGRVILADYQEEMRAGGRYTLGPQVAMAEAAWAAYTQTKHAIGVNSGTDAIRIGLKALGVGPGWTVLTVPNTFYATVNAVLDLGASVQLMDIDDRFLMSSEEASKTGADVIIPVHWAGDVVNFGGPDSRSKKDRPGVIFEDACQAIGGRARRGPAGHLGIAAAFSAHPLKNLNAMGDAGMLVTDDDEIAEYARLYRNHGLVGRDFSVMAGALNSRLDTLQAIPILRQFESLDEVTNRRIANAKMLDEGLSSIPQVRVPERAASPHVSLSPRHVYHLYQIEVEDRDGLLRHLIEHGVEAKVHYPVPLHLQPAFFDMLRARVRDGFFERWGIPPSMRLWYIVNPWRRDLGYTEGDFPRAEAFASNHITLPVHQYLDPDDVAYMVDQVEMFYEKS